MRFVVQHWVSAFKLRVDPRPDRQGRACSRPAGRARFSRDRCCEFSVQGFDESVGLGQWELDVAEVSFSLISGHLS